VTGKDGCRPTGEDSFSALLRRLMKVRRMSAPRPGRSLVARQRLCLAPTAGSMVAHLETASTKTARYQRLDTYPLNKDVSY
jgi:hypothetical protein